MSLKQELKQFRKPFVGFRRYEHHSHIIIFTEKETDDAQHYFCHASEVEPMFNFLQERVWAVRVIELGKEVASYYEQEFAAL